MVNDDLGELTPLSRAITVCGAAALVLVIGVLDSLTGVDLSLHVLYLGPCAFVAWRIGRGPAFALSTLSTVVWVIGDSFDGHVSSHPVFAVSNGATLLCFLLVSTAMLGTIRESFVRERRHARVDALTGLWNTRAFRELSERELSLAERDHSELCVAYLDLDDFKRVNDTLGHLKADELLREVGKALRGALRSSDIVGRVGGDEFAVVMPRTQAADAEPVLKRALRAVIDATRAAGFSVTFSLGFVATRGEDATFESLLRRADRSMYDVKRAGKAAVRSQRRPAPHVRFRLTNRHENN